MQEIPFWPEVLEAMSKSSDISFFKEWADITNASLNPKEKKINIIVPNDIIKTYLTDNINLLSKIIEDIMMEKMSINISIDSSLNKEDIKKTKITDIKEFKEDKNKKNMFIPRFTFENFIVGSNNQFAHASALSVAVRPSESYNPLFIFANSGLGKTHLLHAIGNYICEYVSSKKVVYISAERFFNEFTKAILMKKTHDFRKKYRDEYDVVLIDDIQFITGKEGFQEELFNMISSTQGSNKQIVVASDKYPDKIEGLDDRLRTRFSSGLICDIKVPEIETRIAIIISKAAELNIVIPQNAAIKIAEKFTKSIRELEGAVTSLSAFASFANTEITPSLIDEVFKNNDSLKVIKKEIKITEIIRKVASFFNVTYDEIIGSSRKNEFILPRHISMYISKKLSKKSLADIAKIFKRNNHSSILHAYEKIEKKQKQDINLKKEIESIISELENI